MDKRKKERNSMTMNKEKKKIENKRQDEKDVYYDIIQIGKLSPWPENSFLTFGVADGA